MFRAWWTIPAARFPLRAPARIWRSRELPRAAGERQATTVTFTYDGRLTGQEESPIYGIKFGAIQNDIAYLMYPARWFPVNGYSVDRFTSDLHITVPSGYQVIASGLRKFAARRRRARQPSPFNTPSPRFPEASRWCKAIP
jgi:hypothetical protein